MPEKSVILVSRKAGLTREAFRDHYEQVHVPLALKWFGFDKYVRNHVVCESAGFDCFAEFWPHDPDQVRRAAIAGAKVFADDDALFMHHERRGGTVDEEHIAGIPRAFDPPGTSKAVYLISSEAGLSSWAQGEVRSGQALRITADRPRPGAEGNLGKITIVSVWRHDDERPATPLASVVELATTAVIDTPAAVLRRARGALKSE